ncbi:MAG: lipoyl protein ligase domain-containing protein, partial [Planctomycetota bacterium]
MTIQALLDREMEIMARGKPHAYLWETDQRAVVMGVSGKAEREAQVQACKEDGIPILKRRSGGGTVLLGPGVLCWGVALPPRDCLCAPKALADEVLPL